MSEKEAFQRLPVNICPKNYKVHLQPDLVKCTFKGSVEIDIKITEPSSHIVLNCVDLNIGDVCVTKGGQSYTPSKCTPDTAKEVLDIEFSSNLDTGEAVLKIDFDGLLNDKLKGFYRSKYNVGNEVQYAAVTQFEATDARRCFPCWDEPAIKSTFDVTLTVPCDKVALSNMNELSKEPHPTDTSLCIRKFARTPIMSTYLLAVIVGEYDYVEEVLPEGTTIRVFTPVGKKEQGLFALMVASKVLPYYKEYFQIDYPLPKMDLIAISDFCVGAMENWGLITYRECLLLVDPENTSSCKKQSIATVVGHEIAHQWFGNLVTMEWWTHLWLNEGYATFGEFLCVNHLFPEYDIWTQFVTDTYTCALKLDALKNSHPIEVPVSHPSEVDEIFDDISYSKGASVIRMIHNYIGDEDFRKGMNLYLNRHRFGNTCTQDLWNALGESSGKAIGRVMSNWTVKTGFPMITVSSRQDGNNIILSLTQQRFLADGSTDPSGTEWIVPMSIMTAKSGLDAIKHCTLESKSSEVVLENVSKDDWVKINVNSVGYYRTRYPSEMQDQLQPAIASKSLPPLDRLGVIDDLFAMVRAGHASTVEVLQLLGSYEEETDYTVWSAIQSILSQLNQLLSHTSYQASFMAFVRRLLVKVAARVGWDAKPDESHLDTLLRSLVLHRLGTFGEASVVEEASKRFSAHLKGTALIPADLRSAVYKTVLGATGETYFQQMIELYRVTELHEEKERISSSLGTCKDPQLIQKVLQFAMSEDVRTQDAVFVMISVTHSKNGRAAAWDFLKTRLHELVEKYEGGPLLARLVKCVTENFASEEMAREIEEFFRGKNIPGTDRILQQSVECVRLNAAWLKRDSDSIEKFLNEHT